MYWNDDSKRHEVKTKYKPKIQGIEALPFVGRESSTRKGGSHRGDRLKLCTDFK